MLKMLQAGLQQYVHWELSYVQAKFRKSEELEIKFPTLIGSYRKQVNSRKMSSSASLAMLKLCVCGSQQTVKNS